jgi:multiple PDZ domain protein
MVVFRDEASVKEEDMFNVMDVELTKKPGKGLGLSIVGRKNGNGVFISDVVSVSHTTQTEAVVRNHIVE